MDQTKIQANLEQAKIQAQVEMRKIDSSSNLYCTNLRNQYEGARLCLEKVTQNMKTELYLKLAEYNKHLPALEAMAKKLRDECGIEVALPARPCPVITIYHEPVDFDDIIELNVETSTVMVL